MQICPPEKCTGCYACVNACSHGCISMKEDHLGAIHPVIDDDICIHCNLCVKSCPNNCTLEFNYPIKCYASWITDSAKRRICASGGIGTIMSEYVISKGGVVFGSRYDENLTPIMAYTEKKSDLEYFKGSRYVQSLVGNFTFKQVRLFLNKGRLVLFIGTPCQVAGLKTFLHRDYDNLVTVDLICHGVCPTRYLKEEINYLSTKYGFKDISDIRFRGNDGKDFYFSLWKKTESDDKCIYCKQAYSQYYFSGFLLGVTMRENCYSCIYARPDRVSDITIGDFIGLGDNVPFNYSKRNVSSVTINSKHGQIFYLGILQSNYDWMNVERTYNERLNYKPSLVEPFPRHKLNKIFVQNYSKYGYIKASRMTLRMNIYKNNFKLSFIYRIIRFFYRHIKSLI